MSGNETDAPVLMDTSPIDKKLPDIPMSEAEPTRDLANPLTNAALHELDKKRSLFKQKVKGPSELAGLKAEILTGKTQVLFQPQKNVLFTPQPRYESVMWTDLVV